MYPLENSPISTWGNHFVLFVQGNLQWVVALWMLGFLLFNVRIVGGYLYLHKLKSQYIQPLSEFWQHKFLAQKERLGISKPVRLYESWKTSVPVAMGYLKPVVLLPIGLAANLSVQQVEAILAHELAHIQRSDFLVNLIQQLLRAAYFFNPGFLMLSKLIDRERENCCDDLVIDQGNDKMAYARALESIQHYQMQNPMLAMSLASGKKPVLFRIQRLFNQSMQVPGKKEKIIPAVILLLSLTCVSWYSLTLKDKVKKQAGAEMARMHFSPDVLKQAISVSPDTADMASRHSSDTRDVDVTIDKNVDVNANVSVSPDVQINIDSMKVSPKAKVKTKVIYQFKNSDAPRADSVKAYNFIWSSDSDDWTGAAPQPDFQFMMPPMPEISEDLQFGMMAPPFPLDSPAVKWQFGPDPFDARDMESMKLQNEKMKEVQSAMRAILDKNNKWRMKMDSMREQAMRQVEKSEAYKALQEQMQAQQEKMRAEQEKMREKIGPDQGRNHEPGKSHARFSCPRWGNGLAAPREQDEFRYGNRVAQRSAGKARGGIEGARRFQEIDDQSAEKGRLFGQRRRPKKPLDRQRQHFCERP